ncbi:MAG: DUF3800 domain-containing protein [Deltaproteobacteria bacterium]|nr:DUF3800 domain-containing protein [Deltaproteobacteria bacterium]
MRHDIFCDESRHLEKDTRNRYMILGGIWCPSSEVTVIGQHIKEIRKRNRCFGEIKWVNVCPSKINFYIELAYLLFSETSLSFRCIVADKLRLKHQLFYQTHDIFFYKLYYFLIKKKVRLNTIYHIYIEHKDCHSQEQIQELHRILNRKFWYRIGVKFPEAKSVISKDKLLLQLADFFIGAVGYRYNGFSTSEAKMTICQKVCALTGRKDLNYPSRYAEEKFDIFEIGLQ